MMMKVKVQVKAQKVKTLPEVINRTMLQMKKAIEKTSYASPVGALLIKKFVLDVKEINGVFRAGINPIKQSGFMKILMNGPIYVNQRFGSSRGVAEDDRVKVIIIGGKKKDEVLIRVVNPPELLDNKVIFRDFLNWARQ